ncbi:hypothetical protein AK95_20390 [Paenibacillus sp. LC231]|uniref:hypothetical protein n=1 Tax=Paenibacillus sp. LC231 TaxID=1120679 RepID=UPI0008DC8B20|nr:hypothetical protein [Paenibacillus sp. LC231]OIA99532.1 hypothetical protein AK95_20390 [Paenibacillus sp. LC231]
MGQRRALTLVRYRFVLSATPFRYSLDKIFLSVLQFLAQEDYVKDRNGGTGLTSLEPPFFDIFSSIEPSHRVSRLTYGTAPKVPDLT